VINEQEGSFRQLTWGNGHWKQGSSEGEREFQAEKETTHQFE